MADIQINYEYITTIDEFIKQLEKKWKISPGQKERMRHHAADVGTTKTGIRGGRKIQFVVGDQWLTDIVKGGKLMIKFTGGFVTDSWVDGREGIIPRVYLTKQKNDKLQQ